MMDLRRPKDSGSSGEGGGRRRSRSGWLKRGEDRDSTPARRPHAPDSLERNSEQEATQRTDALLRQLPERDWTVLGDFDPRHGIDHVLVGPSGVFVIASRKPEGAGARVRDGVLWLRKGADARMDRPGVAINREALDAARTLHREIRARTGRGPAVSPVVVLWCEFPQRVAESSQLSFVQGRELRAWLSRRPQQLDESGRGEIVQALKAIPHPAHRRLPHIGTRRHVA